MAWSETLVCLSTVAIGDGLAVEIAQHSHFNLLQQLAGCLRDDEVIAYRCPIPGFPEGLFSMRVRSMIISGFNKFPRIFLWLTKQPGIGKCLQTLTWRTSKSGSLLILATGRDRFHKPQFWVQRLMGLWVVREPHAVEWQC